jgi:hypothetical protein
MLGDLSEVSLKNPHRRNLAIADHLSKLMGRSKGQVFHGLLDQGFIP